ncbi:MAG: hypothetical protein ACOVRM_08855, partial [Planctomycetaceae bacterium]
SVASVNTSSQRIQAKPWSIFKKIKFRQEHPLEKDAETAFSADARPVMGLTRPPKCRQTRILRSVAQPPTTS